MAFCGCFGLSVLRAAFKNWCITSGCFVYFNKNYPNSGYSAVGRILGCSERNKLDSVKHACNPRAQRVKCGGSEFQSHPQLHKKETREKEKEKRKEQ